MLSTCAIGQLLLPLEPNTQVGSASFKKLLFFFACYFSLKTCLLQKHTIPVNYNTKIAFLFEKEKRKKTKIQN